MERMLKERAASKTEISDRTAQGRHLCVLLLATVAMLTLAGCNKTVEPDQRMIDLAVRAQEHDGYIGTQTRARGWERFKCPNRHELYTMGQKGISDELQAKLDTFRSRVKKEIAPKYPDACVADFVDHIDHAVQLIGIDHVGIASDFDGGGGIVGFQNAGEAFNVTLELVRRGYDKEQIGKLWSGNTLRVLEAVEKVAAR